MNVDVSSQSTHVRSRHYIVFSHKSSFGLFLDYNNISTVLYYSVSHNSPLRYSANDHLCISSICCWWGLYKEYMILFGLYERWVFTECLWEFVYQITLYFAEWDYLTLVLLIISVLSVFRSMFYVWYLMFTGLLCHTYIPYQCQRRYRTSVFVGLFQ